MSGSAKKDQPPRNDAEFARDQDRRIEALENSDAVRAGKWVFSTQDGTGNLIASYEDGGSHVVAKVPTEGTGADDVTEDAQVPVIVQYIPPRIQVRRTSNQNINNVTFTTVLYESTEFSEGTNPITANLGAGTLTIGETGVYQITAEWQWAGSASVCNLTVLIDINGASTAEDTRIRQNITTGQTISVTRSLNQGDVLRMTVWQDSGGVVGGGASHGGDISGRFNCTLVQAAYQPDSGQPPDPTPIQGG